MPSETPDACKQELTPWFAVLQGCAAVLHPLGPAQVLEALGLRGQPVNRGGHKLHKHTCKPLSVIISYLGWFNPPAGLASDWAELSSPAPPSRATALLERHVTLLLAGLLECFLRLSRCACLRVCMMVPMLLRRLCCTGAAHHL